jgi:drug/metabolite transporter (DMT)-like permease
MSFSPSHPLFSTLAPFSPWFRQSLLWKHRTVRRYHQWPALLKGLLWGTVAAVLFGLMASMVHAGSRGLPNAQLLSIRGLMSVALVLPLVWQRIPKYLSPKAAALWLRVLYSCFSIRIFFQNLEQIGSANASLLVNASLIFTLLLELWLYRLKPTYKEIVAVILVLLACFGLSFFKASSVTTGSLSVPLWNLGIGLVGAFFTALAYLTVKDLRKTWRNEDILFCYALGQMLAGCLPPQSGAWQWPDGTEWWVLGVMGASSALNQLCLASSYLYLKASLASMLMLLGVVAAALFDWALLDVAPNWVQGACALLMLAGLALALSPKTRSNPS